MALQNDFLPFAASSGANVLTQAQYLGLSTLIANGFSSGVAPSVQLNKVWRQSSIMAAMLAQFISDGSAQPAIDDGTIATLETNLFSAVRTAARISAIATDTGAVNAYTTTNVPPITALTNGALQYVTISHANTGGSTYAPDGLAAKPIVGLGTNSLQGGELIAGGIVELLYSNTINGGNGGWILIGSYGGAMQTAPATQSGHAVNLGQFASSANWQRFASGIILQWGNLTAPTSATTTYNYPIAFPNGIGFIVACKGSVISLTGEYTVGVSVLNASQFRITNSYPSTGSSQGVCWMAIGN